MDNVTRVELPDGGWVELYDAAKVPERRRRPIQRASLAMQQFIPQEQRATLKVVEAPEGTADPSMGSPPVDEVQAEVEEMVRKIPIADLPSGSLEAIDGFNDALILGFTTAWSFGDTVDEANLIELPGDAYDAILRECQARNNGARKAGDEESAAASPDVADPTSPSGA